MYIHLQGIFCTQLYLLFHLKFSSRSTRYARLFACVDLCWFLGWRVNGMKENLVEIIFIHMLSIMIQLIEIWIRSDKI